VRDAVAFLAAATTRPAIKSPNRPQHRRETHTGTWLPDPVDIEADLSHSAERAEVLDRRCSCSSRACLPSNEPPTCSAKRSTTSTARSPKCSRSARQTPGNSPPARASISPERHRQVSAAQHQRFLDAFVDAAQTGDLTTLEGLLAADVVTSVPGTIAA
jgi:RNA polymerase sigma-70 factor (ECF subfamily)